MNGFFICFCIIDFHQTFFFCVRKLELFLVILDYELHIIVEILFENIWQKYYLEYLCQILM